MKRSSLATRACCAALSMALASTMGCARAGAPKGHARAIKPAPLSVQPDSVSHRNPDSTSLTPRVGELMADEDRIDARVIST